jgi:hypothetical protein
MLCCYKQYKTEIQETSKAVEDVMNEAGGAIKESSIEGI